MPPATSRASSERVGQVKQPSGWPLAARATFGARAGARMELARSEPPSPRAARLASRGPQRPRSSARLEEPSERALWKAPPARAGAPRRSGSGRARWRPAFATRANGRCRKRGPRRPRARAAADQTAPAAGREAAHRSRPRAGVQQRTGLIGRQLSYAMGAQRARLEPPPRRRASAGLIRVDVEARPQRGIGKPELAVAGILRRNVISSIAQSLGSGDSAI